MKVAQLYIEDCKDRKLWKEAEAAATNADADAAAGAAAYAAFSTFSVYADDAAAAYVDATAAAAAAYYYKRMADKLIELINEAPLKEIP